MDGCQRLSVIVLRSSGASTPRGDVELVYQERKGVRKGSGWQRVYLARRARTQDWRDGSTILEAVRKALLLRAGKQPGWLAEVAADLERQLKPPADGAAQAG